MPSRTHSPLQFVLACLCGMLTHRSHDVFFCITKEDTEEDRRVALVLLHLFCSLYLLACACISSLAPGAGLGQVTAVVTAGPCISRIKT